MATMASTFLRTARNASLASRAAATASCSAARAAGVVARSRAARLDYSGVKFISPLKNCPTRGDVLRRTFSCAAANDDDGSIIPVDEDLESDEAVWALYERWRKAFNKERDHAEMARRFKLFKYNAHHVHSHNTYVPYDPEEAAIHLCKRREFELLFSIGKDVSHIDDQYLPLKLYQNADGSDPFPSKYDKMILKHIDIEAHRRGGTTRLC